MRMCPAQFYNRSLVNDLALLTRQAKASTCKYLVESGAENDDEESVKLRLFIDIEILALRCTNDFGDS